MTSLEDVRVRLEEAAETGKWMAAVWQVKDGQIKLVSRVTHDFPSGDFLAAVGHLSMNLFEEQRQMNEPAQPPVPEPLPKADIAAKPEEVSPILQVFQPPTGKGFDSAGKAVQGIGGSLGVPKEIIEGDGSRFRPDHRPEFKGCKAVEGLEGGAFPVEEKPIEVDEKGRPKEVYDPVRDKYRPVVYDGPPVVYDGPPEEKPEPAGPNEKPDDQDPHRDGEGEGLQQ